MKVETLSDFQLYPMRVRVERDESGGKSHFPEQKLEKAAYDREHTSSFASLLKHFLTSGTAAFALFSPTRRARDSPLSVLPRQSASTPPSSPLSPCSSHSSR